MNYAVVTEVNESSEDCLNKGRCFVFLHELFVSELGLQVALVAEFSDDVAVAIAGEDLVALEDVGMIQFFKNLNFGEEELLQFPAFEGIELYYFDGNYLA